MGQRREERLQVTLPIKVWGMDANGKPFIQSAHTVDITRMGARLRDLHCIEKKGDVIRVQHGNQKCNFRVTWVALPWTPEHGQVGVYSVEPDKYIWGQPLPRTQGADSFELHESVELISFEHSSQSSVSQSSVSQSSVSQSGVSQSGAAVAPAAQGEKRGVNKRVHPRYVCSGSIEIAPEDSNMPLWCVLSDISIAGCYAETASPLPAQTRVQVKVRVAGFEFNMRALVRTSHPAVGMGLSFNSMNDVDRDRLAGLIEHLRQDAAAGAAQTNVESKPLSPTITAHDPAKDRSLLAAHNRPAAAEKPAPRIEPSVMERLTQLRSELWEMQHSFPPNTVDSRILRELKEAVDHTRHSIWFAQQWLEMQAEKKDPFPLLDKLMSERLRVAREVNQQLRVDVEAGELDLGLEGIEDLFLTVRDLYSRLSKLLNKS